MRGPPRWCFLVFFLLGLIDRHGMESRVVGLYICEFKMPRFGLQNITLVDIFGFTGHFIPIMIIYSEKKKEPWVDKAETTGSTPFPRRWERSSKIPN